MIICFYVKTIFIESYYRLKNYINKISNYFKDKNMEYDETIQFSNINYNNFNDTDNINNRSVTPLKEIVVTQPKKKSQNLIDNWDIIN